MLMVSFIFTEKNLDADFYALDKAIDEAARAVPGFLGKESWVASDGSKRNSVYYWENKTALDEFSRNRKHLEAKRRYKEWYGGLHIVISEVQKSYGDGAFSHITPNARQRPSRQ